MCVLCPLSIFVLMRSTTLVSVTSDRQLELPPAIQSTLQPGDEYLIW